MDDQAIVAAVPKEGSVHAFLEKGELMLGSLHGSKGSSLKLLCNDGRERLLPQRRILAPCGSLPLTLSREVTLGRLEKLRTQILELAAQIDLSVLWEALVDQFELVDPAELARQWFGPAASAEQITSMTWAVLQESVRFKLKGAQFKLQPRDVVEQKLRELELAARRERQLREALAWIGGGPRPEHCDELIAQLKEVALFGAEAPRHPEIKDLLRKLAPGGHDAVVSFDALVAVGIWDKDENLDLLREGVPLEPDQPVLEAARRALSRTWDGTSRQDWSAHETFSIDPATTLDVDDAISCWVEDGRLKVAIHITDVTEFVELDRELDLDARMRGLSIYLPNRVIPMLPAVLSEEAASLLPGQVRPAITLVLEIGDDGTVLQQRFELSSVRITRKLSYADVDRLLPEDPLMQRLLRFCLQFRQKRLEQGAVLLPLPEVAIRVGQGDRVEVHLEQDSASHQMVSELMICFNASVARWCNERGLPALYRGQPSPRRRLLSAEPTLLECLLQRRQMLRSVTELKPVRHGGLGLEAYTMATSPLRRYLDLCMQWQIRALILGQAPAFDQKKLEELLPYLSVAQRRAQRIERGTQKYWMYRWLEQRPEPLIQGLWLEPISGHDRAALLPFLTEAEVDLRGQKAPKRGTVVDLEIVQVNAREAELKLALRSAAKKLSPESEALASMLPVL